MTMPHLMNCAHIADGWCLDCVGDLHEEVDLDNKRIAELERVLKAIPACPDHGDLCIPHAMEWIAKARAMEAERDKYKAFAEQFARTLFEHGLIKDVAAPIPGTVVHLGLQEQAR